MSDITAGVGKPASPFMTVTGALSRLHLEEQPQWRGGGRPGKLHRRPEGLAQNPAPAAELPLFIEPQLTKPVEKPGAGPGWAHEIKFDGYRMQLRRMGRRRNPEIAQRSRLVGEVSPKSWRAGATLPSGILDGEVVALDHTGAPDFAGLQAAISDRKTANLVFFVFDQMFSATEDLRKLPLEVRKDAAPKDRGSLRPTPSDTSIIS